MAKKLLNDKPFSIHIYPNATQLLQHERGDQLVTLVNDSFHDSNKERFSAKRVGDLKDLVDQVGTQSFSILLTSMPEKAEDEPTLYALGSARPFTQPRPSDSDSPWLTRLPDHEVRASVERWEMKMVCTSPAVKNQGLGSYVMELLELEIRRRFRAVHSRDTSTRPRLELVLTTLLEQNGLWYERRGYETVNSLYIPKGQRIGRFAEEPNREEFHVVTMTKSLAVD